MMVKASKRSKLQQHLQTKQLSSEADMFWFVPRSSGLLPNQCDQHMKSASDIQVKCAMFSFSLYERPLLVFCLVSNNLVIF